MNFVNLKSFVVILKQMKAKIKIIDQFFAFLLTDDEDRFHWFCFDYKNWSLFV